MTPLAVAGVLAAGAIGAPVRYLVDGFIGDVTAGPYPWGTFLINASGSFLFGLLTGLALYHAFPATPKIILGTGFCGAYTTFSTFGVETVRLVEDGFHRHAVVNLVASVVVSLLAAAGGIALAAV